MEYVAYGNPYNGAHTSINEIGLSSGEKNTLAGSNFDGRGHTSQALAIVKHTSPPEKRA